MFKNSMFNVQYSKIQDSNLPLHPLRRGTERTYPPLEGAGGGNRIQLFNHSVIQLFSYFFHFVKRTPSHLGIIEILRLRSG